MTPTIRRATVPDLPSLRLLFVQLIAYGLDKFPSPYPTMDDQEFDNFTLAMYRQLTLNPKFVCFVAEHDGKVLGFLAGEVWERAIGKPNRYGAPHYLFVEPAARGQGIAAALIQAGVGWLRDEGVTHVELAAYAGDHQWERRGWVPYLTKVWASTDAIGAYDPAARAASLTRLQRAEMELADVNLDAGAMERAEAHRERLRRRVGKARGGRPKKMNGRATEAP